MADEWFPIGRIKREGWRLDIVSLLAVIGESSMESHSQALTSSWTCMLPRIIPAPQALLKPTRPTRMPQVNAVIVGVHSGTRVPTLNYFPNIIHPIEELPPFAFRVYHITHRNAPPDTPAIPHSRDRSEGPSGSTSIELSQMEDGMAATMRRRGSISQKAARRLTTDVDKKPRVPARPFSPLNILSVLSCVLTIGLLVWAVLIKDGTAICALGTISLASSIVGYASWWSPVLMNRVFHSTVPDGDVIIRTREGAFIIVKCNEDVCRELYTGTEECSYYVTTKPYRFLVAIGTFLLMISVVLLGNCNFTMQCAIGSSYIILNGAFWATSLVHKSKFWDLSAYKWDDITPEDAENAHLYTRGNSTLEGKPSFTRTMWFAIRETKKTGWVKRSGAAPKTKRWDKWLKAAEDNAVGEVRNWKAVEMRERIIGEAESTIPTREAPHEDSAEQHAPALEVPPPTAK